MAEKVRNLKAGHGLNAATGEYVDMIAEGIIDPAKVTRSALQNAASIAALFLTTEAVVADKPEKAPGDAGGGCPAAWAAWTSEPPALNDSFPGDPGIRHTPQRCDAGGVTYRGPRESGTLVTARRAAGTDADPGPTGRAVLSTACSQVRWQEPPITSRSPWPTGNDPGRGRRRGGAAAAGGPRRGTGSRPWCRGCAAADRVAVPGDAVAAVAVEAHPCGGERLAELGGVVPVERVRASTSSGVGSRSSAP